MQPTVQPATPLTTLQTLRRQWTRGAALAGAAALAVTSTGAAITAQPAAVGIEYRVIATSKTSTMEKELNEAAEAGFRYAAVMGGETAFGGNEVVVVTSRTSGGKGRYAYKLLATSKTSTMQNELRAAAQSGFEYRGQTVFETAFGGSEVVCILERDGDASGPASDYKLVATSRTGTLQKELSQAGAAGYEILGMTVAKTAMGGTELVAITRRIPTP
jgi:hypothetical protein